MKSFEGSEWSVPQQITLIPDIGTYRILPNREIETSLAESIRNEEIILWLTDEQPDDEFMVGAEFEERKDWKKGRADSKQGVFFGYLALADEIEVPVAVKPYLSDVSKGSHETAMLMYLQSLGLPTYQVLGTSHTDSQGFTMITAFEEESRSLDNVVWAKGLDRPLGEHLTNLEAIEQVGQSLGLMHGNGIIHNDAQIKNFAVNGDTVVLIDLAQARSATDGGTFVDEALLRKGMYRDLSTLINDLRKKKFIGDASRQDVGRFIENVIATSYRSGLYRAHGIVEREVHDYRQIVEATLADILDQYYS